MAPSNHQVTASSGAGHRRRMGLCARAADCYWRMQERATRWGGQWAGDGRYPGGLGALPDWQHQITPDCTLVSGRNDPALLALDREEVHRRAASMRSRRPFWWGAAVSIVGVAIAASMFVFPLHKWTTGDLGEHVLRAWMVLFMLYFLAVNIGRPDFILYLVRRCANVFQGTSGVDDARPVADWLDRHWRWFAPPAFLTDDTVWAIGRWRDRPSLLTFERSDSRLSFAAFLWFVRGLTSGPRGRRQGFDTPPSMICRLSVFIGGSTLRTDVQAQATLRELHDWGWGVVGTPGGVYVYHRAYERTLRLRVFLPILDKVINATVAQPQASEGT